MKKIKVAIVVLFVVVMKILMAITFCTLLYRYQEDIFGFIILILKELFV